MTTMADRCFDAGYKARMRGEANSANPFQWRAASVGEAAWWSTGWQAADDEIKNAADNQTSR